MPACARLCVCCFQHMRHKLALKQNTQVFCFRRALWLCNSEAVMARRSSAARSRKEGIPGDSRPKPLSFKPWGARNGSAMRSLSPTYPLWPAAKERMHVDIAILIHPALTTLNRWDQASRRAFGDKKTASALPSPKAGEHLGLMMRCLLVCTGCGTVKGLAGDLERLPWRA
jgi:hypothetical protein